MLGAHGILGWIVIGGLAGAIAKAVMPGRDPGGCIVTIILGICGAVVAGYLGQLLHIYGPGDNVGFLAAIVGAFIILFVYRLIAGRRRL